MIRLKGTSWSRGWLSLLSVVLLLCVVGCTGPQQPPLVGKWVRQDYVDWNGSSTKAKLSVDIHPDGTFLLRTQVRAFGPVKTTNGTWRVYSDDGTFIMGTDGSGIGTEVRVINGELVAHPDTPDPTVWKRRLW